MSPTALTRSLPPPPPPAGPTALALRASPPLSLREIALALLFPVPWPYARDVVP